MNMKEEYRKQLLDLFYHIRENGPIDGSEGICSEVWCHFGFDSNVSKAFDAFSMDAFRTWPEGSGSGVFPMRMNRGMNWDKSTELGQKRYRLLDYLIAKLEAGE